MQRTKRSLLSPSKEDSSLSGVEPASKRFHGLCTPPASPENRELGVDTSLSTSDSKLQPRRLLFEKDSIYSRTKSALQISSFMFNEEPWLPTRKDQYMQISEFLQETIASNHGNSLYITGPPGTGKTAQLELLIRQSFQFVGGAPENKDSVKCLGSPLASTYYYDLGCGTRQTVCLTTLNCIALRRPEAIWSKIHAQFSVKNEESGRVRTMEDLQKFIQGYPKTAFVVVLDEMDKLLTSTLEDTNATKIIVNLFLLAKMSSVRFTLIGIANSLDMRERFLNRLALASEFLPRIISFTPYTADQMFEIVTNRLKSVCMSDFLIQPMAIKFAAKRCSSNTGDLRKLFDILRNSVEIAELELIRNMESDSIIRVNLSHVAKVFSLQMDNSSRTRIAKLSTQQKMVLCAIVHREKYDINQGRCSIDDAYDYYSKLLLRTVALNPLERKEFFESCDALEMCGVVSIEHGKSGKKAKQLVKLIKSTVDIKKLNVEISKVDLLRRIYV